MAQIMYRNGMDLKQARQIISETFEMKEEQE